MEEEEERSFDEVCRLWMEVKHLFRMWKKRKVFHGIFQYQLLAFFLEKALKAGHMSVKCADLTVNRGISYIFIIGVWPHQCPEMSDDSCEDNIFFIFWDFVCIFVLLYLGLTMVILRVSSYPCWDFLDSLATWCQSSSSQLQRWQQISSTG